MSKYKEIVYAILDELKLSSDDAFFTEDHIIYLIDKYRAFILKQKYSDIKKAIPESNYQTICIDLIEVPALPELLCEGTMLKSKEVIPSLMKIGHTTVYPINYYVNTTITYVSRDRMRYIGYNKYLQNVIYCSIAPDSHLWLKSNNPQYLYLEKVRMTGIFENASEAIKLSCDNSIECDILEADFPCEDSLISMITELVLKELTSSVSKTTDDANNSHDDINKQQAYNNN